MEKLTTVACRMPEDLTKFVRGEGKSTSAGAYLKGLAELARRLKERYGEDYLKAGTNLDLTDEDIRDIFHGGRGKYPRKPGAKRNFKPYVDKAGAEWLKRHGWTQRLGKLTRGK